MRKKALILFNIIQETLEDGLTCEMSEQFDSITLSNGFKYTIHENNNGFTVHTWKNEECLVDSFDIDDLIKLLEDAPKNASGSVGIVEFNLSFYLNLKTGKVSSTTGIFNPLAMPFITYMENLCRAHIKKYKSLLSAHKKNTLAKTKGKEAASLFAMLLHDVREDFREPSKKYFLTQEERVQAAHLCIHLGISPHDTDHQERLHFVDLNAPSQQGKENE